MRRSRAQTTRAVRGISEHYPSSKPDWKLDRDRSFNNETQMIMSLNVDLPRSASSRTCMCAMQYFETERERGRASANTSARETLGLLKKTHRMAATHAAGQSATRGGPEEDGQAATRDARQDETSWSARHSDAA